MATIILADDHPVVRLGLRLMLEMRPGLSVVAESSDGPETLAQVRLLQPDVLVLDLMMPGPTGLQLCRQMAAIAPHTRVIILSAHANEAYVWEAIRNGARAYVLKSASTTDLVQAIDAVMQGERYYSSPFTADSLAHYTAQRAAGTDPGAFLTARELEVLHLAAQGLSAAEIGAQLVISPRTAEKHRAHLLAKLNLRSQTELVRWAVERGIA